MRLFPKGDIVSIHTVYCGVSEHFFVLIKVCYKCSPNCETGTWGRVSDFLCFVKFALDGKDVNE